MAMDNELRKILLREQDLRFVTDTLGQYLGKRAEERKYYADLSHKERIEAEKARIAALGGDKAPKNKAILLNITEEDWKNEDKANHLLSIGFNKDFIGQDTKYLNDAQIGKTTSLAIDYSGKEDEPAKSTPKPTTKYVSITKEHWKDENISKFLLSIGYKQGDVIDTAEERNLSTEEILAGEKVGFRFVGKPTSAGDNKDITYNLTLSHMKNEAITKILNQHALIPSDFTGSKKLNLPKDVITELQKLGLTGEITAKSAPSVKAMYFTMPTTLNDNQRTLLKKHGFDPTKTGLSFDGEFTNADIREFKKTFNTTFLSSQKPEDSETIDYKNKVTRLINNKLSTPGLVSKHEKYLKNLLNALPSMSLDKDSYEMLRNLVKTYDASADNVIKDVYINLQQTNKEKQRTIIKKYQSQLVGGVEVTAFISAIPANEKQKLIDLYEKHEEYRYKADDANLNVITFGTEYNDKGNKKTLEEFLGDDWDEGFDPTGEYAEMPATGTNIGWLNLIVGIHTGRANANSVIPINGKEYKVSDIASSPESYSAFVEAIKESYAQNAANWDYQIPITLIVDEPGIGGLLAELLDE